MAVNGGWEVVSGKKNTKAPKGPTPKGKKKNFLDNMPKLEKAPPVEESPTIYQAFIEEEQRKEKRLMESEKENQSKTSNSLAGTKKNSSSAGTKKREKVPPLEEALDNIEVEELDKVLLKDRNLFPNSPEVWLKDLASQLNVYLDKIPDPDPLCNGKPHDYPLCLMTKPVKKMLMHTMSEMTPATLDSFLEHCIESLMNDISKGVTAHGYRLFIQLLLSKKPEIAITSLTKYEILLQKNSGRPLRGLCILWSIGQAGLGSLANGLKVWLQMMLPLLNVRNLNHYVVQYLETLFRLHPKLESGFNVVTKTDYFRLFGELYSLHSSLTSELKQRLFALYPMMKAVAWGDTSTNLHVFFPGYLTRCTPDCHESKKIEILNCLVKCLTDDVQSFSNWRQDYHKNMAQSSVLLQFVADNLDKLDINQKVLRETVRAFHLTNEEFASKPVAHSEDYQLCVASCKALLTRLNKALFPWRWILIFVLLVTMTLFASDVYVNGSIHQSITYRTLAGAGVFVALDNAWLRVCLYSNKVWQWLVENVPYYVQRGSEMIGPYVQLPQQKLVHFWSVVANATEPQRIWLAETSAPLLQKMVDSLPVLLEYVARAIELSMTALLWVFSTVLSGYTIASDWLLHNVFIGSLSPENLSKGLSDLIALVQQNVAAAYQWTIKLF